jgi:transposase
MYHVRKTKTASDSTAIQIVKYVNRKTIVVVHIGSGKTEEEVASLKTSAEKWIEKNEIQLNIFSNIPKKTPCSLISLDKCKYLGVKSFFVYEILHKLLSKFKLTELSKPLLMDLIIMRIIEPSSKLRSLSLLKEYFDISYSEKQIYTDVPKFIDLKTSAEKHIVTLAVSEFNFDFSLVFYDVTTLYFESFESDELRKPGFSKDSKSNQPQIVIGLIVSKNGFPVAYEIFEGNKFEGHTIIPVITDFKEKHQIKTLTVVADAAMISFANVQSLKENELQYIVGARMSSLPPKLLESLSKQLQGKDSESVRIKTPHGDMVCSFSAKRYSKDKREMEKQIKKAESLLQKPSGMKRVKFIASDNNTKYELNTKLIEKAKLLLGLKGYYTNLGEEIENQTIIEHYHNLWHVEQAFRVAKSDLQTRPIYHFKQEAIKGHVLICFMALAVSKYIEIKTGKSIRYVIHCFKQITDATIQNVLTGEKVTMRLEISEEIKDLLKKLGLPYS